MIREFAGLPRTDLRLATEHLLKGVSFCLRVTPSDIQVISAVQDFHSSRRRAFSTRRTKLQYDLASQMFNVHPDQLISSSEMLSDFESTGKHIIGPQHGLPVRLKIVLS